MTATMTATTVARLEELVLQVAADTGALRALAEEPGIDRDAARLALDGLGTAGLWMREVAECAREDLDAERALAARG